MRLKVVLGRGEGRRVPLGEGRRLLKELLKAEVEGEVYPFEGRLFVRGVKLWNGKGLVETARWTEVTEGTVLVTPVATLKVEGGEDEESSRQEQGS